MLISPLSLPASLDFFNAVWRLTHDGERFFDFVSAERTTRLSFDVQTADGYDAQLSALAEILREADKRLTRGTRSQQHPLGKTETDLLGLVDPGEGARVSEAIGTLEAIIALRDAGQHPEASDRAVRAAELLGVPFRPDDPAATRQRLSTEATNAINALREELNAVE